MQKTQLNKEQLVAIGLILLAVVSRLLPHPPNFAPITGIALFTASQFQNKRLAIVVPLLSMLFTDLFLGLSAISSFVYVAFVGIFLLGQTVRKTNVKTVLLSSVLFFVVTNLGVWMLHYPLTIEGLSSCFVLAIPFFTNTLFGDLFYTAALFFTFNKIKQTYLKPA